MRHEWVNDKIIQRLKAHDMIDFRLRDVDLIENGIRQVIDHEEGRFVLSLGGDGNFLRSSHSVRDNKTPLIGINTDPV